MPVFFQHRINETTRLGIWKIEETEEFFKGNVPRHRDVTHPHKRLQHLAGRFLLPFLFPDFPYHLVEVADTRKPFLPGDTWHFSISHCGDYAAAIVSRNKRVGIDIEIPVDKILRIKDKFLSKTEVGKFTVDGLQFAMEEGGAEPAIANRQRLTTLWSAKEAVFKWYGNGGVDFSEHIQLRDIDPAEQTIRCYFSKTEQELTIHYSQFDHLVLAWVMD